MVSLKITISRTGKNPLLWMDKKKKTSLLVWVSAPEIKKIQTPYDLVRVCNETTSPEINH